MRKLAFLAIAAALAVSASANLVPNGGFEVNTTFPGTFGGDTADGWTNISPGTTPDVWDNTGTDGLAPGFAGGYFAHVLAAEGTNWASLVGEPGWHEAIGSSYMALGVGLYAFSLEMIYDVHNPGGYTSPGAIEVYLDKAGGGYSLIGVLAPNTAADTWETRGMLIGIGVADVYSIGLRAVEAAPGTHSFVGIDDVQLNAVPVPEPFSMGLAGLALAAAARRRLRKSA